MCNRSRTKFLHLLPLVTALLVAGLCSFVPDVSYAASAGNTRLILLGTGGGPIIRKLRSQPSSLLVVDGTPYLIDAGDGTMRELAWARFTAQQIRAVFITHHHLDHMAGLGSLMAFSAMVPVPHTMEIYGPPGTSRVVSAAIDYYSISEHLFAAESNSTLTIRDVARAHDIRGAGAVFQDEKVRVSAVENSHFVTMRSDPQSYGADKSYSYRIESKDRTVVFTGDTGPSELLAELAKGADVLVSEVIDLEAVTKMLRSTPGLSEATLSSVMSHMTNEHLSPAEVGKIAQRAGVKMVVLTHFIPGSDSEADYSIYTADVQKVYSGKVVAGRDLDEF